MPGEMNEKGTKKKKEGSTTGGATDVVYLRHSGVVVRDHFRSCSYSVTVVGEIFIYARDSLLKVAEKIMSDIYDS